MSEKEDWQRRIDASARDAALYIKTVDRLEPDITAIDASAYYASAAISLKRIADAMEQVAAEMKDARLRKY